MKRSLCLCVSPFVCQLVCHVLCLLWLGLFVNVASVRAGESEADAISQSIQRYHLPHGQLLDPLFAAPNSTEIIGYARGGDAAIWTGHYLAAESFRYRATGSLIALSNVKRALAGLRLLSEISGTGVLARCAFPANWRYAQSVINEEKRHGIYTAVRNGENYVWVGNTSRDQYSGVFFGLGVTFDFVNDAQVREEAKLIATRLLEYLTSNAWLVKMPTGEISTSFAANPEQRLSFLSVGRRVNATRFAEAYNWARIWLSGVVGSATVIEVLEPHTSYFKFNLATINYFHLIRTEGNATYRNRYLRAYETLRRTTDDHGNPHFNMIDYALRGANATRDAATRQMLDDWLKRPKRDEWRDWRPSGKYPACGEERACTAIPVVDRICTDFLWQRSPFLTWGGGYGTIEGAGIDYLLPYWMARVYGVL